MSDIIPQSILNKTHQDKFILIIDTPPVLKEFETNNARTQKLLNRDKMQYSIVSVNLPTHAIAPVGVPFLGQTTHHTSQTRDEYPPTKVTFTVDNNFDNYFFIWKWMYIMNNPRQSGMDKHFAEFKVLKNTKLDRLRDKILNQSKVEPITYKHIEMVNKYTDYQTTMSLIGLREFNEKVIKFSYFNAFPVTLGELIYDYKQEGELACSFDFSYGQIDVDLIDPI